MAVLLHVILEVLARVRKRNKRHPDLKDRSKLSLFSVDMIFYKQTLKTIPQTVRTNKQIQQSFRIQSQHIKITNNEQFEKDIKKKNPIDNSIKRIKIHMNNLFLTYE